MPKAGLSSDMTDLQPSRTFFIVDFTEQTHLSELEDFFRGYLPRGAWRKGIYLLCTLSPRGSFHPLDHVGPITLEPFWRSSAPRVGE